MNWYKKAYNFLKEPPDLDKKIQEVYTILKAYVKKHYYSHSFGKYLMTGFDIAENAGQHIGRIQIRNPYIEMDHPIDIYVFNDPKGDKGFASSNIYKILKENKDQGNYVEGIDILDSENPTSDWAIATSTPDGDVDLIPVQSFISINLRYFNTRHLFGTIRHEIMHVIDPRTSMESGSYEGDTKNKYFEYLLNPVEYNSRMNVLQNMIIESFEYVKYPSERIRNINQDLQIIREGNLEQFIKGLFSIYMDQSYLGDFLNYYLKHPLTRRNIGFVISKFLLNLLEENKKKLNETAIQQNRIRQNELV